MQNLSKMLKIEIVKQIKLKIKMIENAGTIIGIKI